MKANGEKILVVDDDIQSTEIMRCILENYGYQVITNNHPGNALKKYQEAKNDINLVIADYQMPIMDGLDFASAILSINPDIPIILVTSKFFDSKIIFEAGLKGYLKKPISTQPFIDLCQRAILDHSI
ncbi:MAG: hypothetical protein ACD_15C00113G0010 [uncultured bacterium]|nr:MAG: hypothetical protein ACD_15C00113G0010 [uncultured bacterium]